MVVFKILYCIVIKMGYKRKYRSKARVAKRPVRRRLNFTARLRRSNLAKVIRNVALRNTETKYTVRGSQTWTSMQANTTNLAMANFCLTNTGTQNNNRVGDEVFAIGMKLKIMLQNDQDDPNTAYRLLVIKARPEVDTVGELSDLFDTSVGANPLVQFVNKEKYTTVRDMIVRMPTTDFSREVDAVNSRVIKTVNMWIPMNKTRVKYETTTSSTPKYQKDNYLLVICPTAGEFGGGTTIGSYNIAGRFYFKDP